MGCPYDEVHNEEKQYPLVEETPFPTEDEYKGLVQRYKAWWKFQHSVCMKLLEYIALGLGKERAFFKPWFEKDSLATFRSIHYLPRGQTGVK